MDKKKKLVTLDTNLLQEYWKERPKKETVEKLIFLSKQDEIDLVVTARIREDIPRKPLSDKINKLEELNIAETGSVTRLGCWVLGRDSLGDQNFVDFFQEIIKDPEINIKNPPDWRDLDHLHAHYIQKRDLFLTWDNGILYFRDIFKNNFELIIQKPEEFLKGLRG